MEGYSELEYILQNIKGGAVLVSQIMSRKVVTVEMDDTMRVINDIFMHVRFHHLLVVKNKSLVGVISDRDFLKAISPFINTLSERDQDRATLNIKAHQIMTREPVTVLKNEQVERAAEQMVKKHISCLPVVSEKGKIEGIVTVKDIIRWNVLKKKK